MDSGLDLPLPKEALPASLHRFADPKAPAAAKTMAAKGLVPVKGPDLVTLLVQLSADDNALVSTAAVETLKGVPDNVVVSAAGTALPAAILDGLSRLLSDREPVVEKIVMNAATVDATVQRIAGDCSEYVSEVIAVNQERLLQAPKIIEALYKNRNTRMSTADRLVELAARNDVQLSGIAAFKEHVEAIKGQLIPEPSDEPLPGDELSKEALEEDEDDVEAIQRDKVDGKEELKKRFNSLRDKIAEMTMAEKIRFAQIGDAAARAILVRDPKRTVSFAAIRNMNDSEAASVAHSKEISDDILRFIGNKKEWLRYYDVKRALVFNPKTPTGIALRFIGHLRENDLRALSRSRNIPSPIKTAATQRYQKKQGSRR
ncbi:MAG: hypothetical protein AAGF12_38355 [Myxococcota bacterium]